MYEENIARGVRVLDERKPGWRVLVNLNKFHVMCVDSCVVGQVYQLDSRSFDAVRDWYAALRDLGAPEVNSTSITWEGWSTSPTRRWAIDHGFETDGGYGTYGVLTEEWRQELFSAQAH